MATQWMQDACYHATHDVTPSSNESNSNVMCRFIHNQCEKELFTSEYLRSNKASGHKNLRCFPHCCGGHNPKSFCGSGLVIECFLPNCQLVLGRFEEVAKQQSSSKSENSSNPSQEHCSLLIGHTYARQDLFNDVKMPDQPFGRWFRGTSVPNGTTSGMCFLLNGNRQSWHYGWQSSRLNCKNLHVFRVYLFETNGTNVLCIATVASPPFRISSSRKARKTFRTPLAPSTNATPHCHDMIATGKSSTTWYPNISLSTTSLVPSDPTKRERKRLTRSASLKTEYYSTKAFPISTTQDSSSTRQTCSFSSSERDSRFSMPSLPSVDTFFTTSSHFSSRRSSLAALCMPISMENEESPRILTPISGMMDLRLDSSRHLSFTPNPLHQHAYTSARPLPYIRCDTWSSTLQPLKTMVQMPSSDTFLNRKRNRSTDSDKAINAAIEASEKIHPTQTSGFQTPVPTDSELYRRARILQLAGIIIKRIHRFEQIISMDSSRVIRHSFEMLTPPRMTAEESEARKWTIVSIPLSNSKLLHLCSNLVTLCTTLIHAGVLEDMRQKLRDCAQASRGILAAYQQLVDFLSQAVETQVVNLPRWKHAMESNEESTWDLYEMLKHSEPWLIHEPWWVVLDTDDQEQAGDKDEGVLRPLPYLQVFTDYYRAIQDAVPSRQDIEVATSLRNAALTGAIGLTGEWHRQGEFDEHHLQQPHCVASIRSATTASSLSWFARCIHAHMTKTFQITETNETMTISLSNSLVSPDAVFLLQLNEPEPTVVFPQDYFPFGWSRKRLVMAYRAWRVRAIGDSNGSAVAVQFMRWPDHQDLELWEHDDEEDVNEKNLNAEREPEEEPNHQTGKFRRLRTRITMYFSVFSTTTLQVRTIVETSFAPIAITTSTTHPSEMDMLKYFKSPSSWEMRSQISQQYTKSL